MKPYTLAVLAFAALAALPTVSAALDVVEFSPNASGVVYGSMAYPSEPVAVGDSFTVAVNLANGATTNPTVGAFGNATLEVAGCSKTSYVEDETVAWSKWGVWTVRMDSPVCRFHGSFAFAAGGVPVNVARMTLAGTVTESDRVAPLDGSWAAETVAYLSTIWPVLAFAVAVLWAEKARSPILYVLAGVLGILAIANAPSLTMTFALLLILAVALVRGAQETFASKDE